MFTVTLFGRTVYLSKAQWLLSMACMACMLAMALYVIYTGLHALSPWLFPCWVMCWVSFTVNGKEYAIVPVEVLRTVIGYVGAIAGIMMYMIT